MLQLSRTHRKVSSTKVSRARRLSTGKSLAILGEVLEHRALLTVVASAGPGVNWLASSVAGTDTFDVQLKLSLDTNGDKIADDSTSQTGTASIFHGSPVDTNGDGYKDTVNFEIVSFHGTGNYQGIAFDVTAGDGVGDLKSDNSLYSPGTIQAESQNSYFASTTLDINYNLTAEGESFSRNGTFQADHIDRFVPFASVYTSDDYTPINSTLAITHAELRMIPTDQEPVGLLTQNGSVLPAPGTNTLSVTYTSVNGYLSDNALQGDSILAIAPNGTVESTAPTGVFNTAGANLYVDPVTHQVTGSSSVLVTYYVHLPVAGNYTVEVPGSEISDMGGVSMQQQSLGGFTVLGSNSPLVTANADTFVLTGTGTNTASGALSVLANDVSADQQPQDLKATILSTVTHGHLTLNQNGTFIYTPDSSFQGIDQFTYQVSEGSATSAATVTLLSYNASLVDKLYHQVLGRSAEVGGTPTDGGLIGWTEDLNKGGKLDDVAKGIFLSPERLNPLVTQFYHDYLGRNPEENGLNGWVANWQQYQDPGAIVLDFLSSPEFYGLAGGTDDGFVRLLYARVLGRTASGAEVAGWIPQVEQTGRYQVAAGFYESPELHYKLVEFLFSEYFQGSTAPDPTPYVNQLNQGQTRTQVELAIIDSLQYQDTPPQPPAGSVGRALYEYVTPS